MTLPDALPRRLLLSALLVFLAVTLYHWPPNPFWPDALGYRDHILHHDWVAHPPGYLGFVALGRLFHLFFSNAHFSAQLASFFLTLASFPALYLALRTVLNRPRSLILLAGFITGWLPLMLARTGTSHAADLFTSGLLMLTALRINPEMPATRRQFMAFYGALVLTAFFRLTTLIFFLPLVALLTLFHWKRPSWWLCALTAAATVLILQLAVIRLSGGWAAYHTYAAAMHRGNAASSLLYSGFNKATLLNFARGGFWWLLSVLPALALSGLLLFQHAKLTPVKPRLWILLAALAGPLAGPLLYLATHCGYLAPAVPPAFCLAAYLWSLVPPKKIQVLILVSTALLFLFFFLLAKPFITPRTPARATANALLLQYTNHGFQSGTWKSLAKWLHDTGQQGLVPAERARDMERPDAM